MEERSPGGRTGRREARGSSMPIVRSVERASRIMQTLLAAGPEGKRVSELCAELGLHKTTVIRLLRTLSGAGGVRKDEETGRYSWDPLTWVVLADQLRKPIAVRTAIQHVLRELAQVTEASAVVGRPDLGSRRLRLVGYALPDRPMRVDPGEIRSVPIHGAAGGKAYLATLGKGELEKWLGGPLAQQTEHTITSAEELRQELARVRKRGYGMSREELFPGSASIGIALVDGKGEPVGTLDLVGHAGMLRSGNVRRWVPLLRAAGGRISHLVYQTTADGHEAGEGTGAGGAGADVE